MCVALGNIKDPLAVPALVEALFSRDALIREHAAWALGRIGGEDSITALKTALDNEDDTSVSEEIELSLTDLVTVSVD